MYNISITNEYDTRITDVSVSAQLIKGMKFESTRYYEANRGLLNVTSAPIEFKNDTETKLILDIGMLEPEETKSIILETYIKSYVTDANLTVEVTGKLGAISVSAKGARQRQITANSTKTKIVPARIGVILNSQIKDETI